MAVDAALATGAVWLGTAEVHSTRDTTMDWLRVLPLIASVATVLTALNEAGYLGSANRSLVVVLPVLGVVFFADLDQVEKRAATR